MSRRTYTENTRFYALVRGQVDRIGRLTRTQPPEPDALEGGGPWLKNELLGIERILREAIDDYEAAGQTLIQTTESEARIERADYVDDRQR